MNPVEDIIKAIEHINVYFYPFSLIIPIILSLSFLFFLFFNIKNPTYKKSNYLKIVIALSYFYAGIPLFFTTEQMGITNAVMGGTILSFFGVIFFISIFNKKMIFVFDKKKYIKIISFILIFTGIFLYPILEYITGLSWPGIALFGMECPTTISVIGLLILSYKNIPKYFLVILSITASLMGTYVAISGLIVDWTYALAGYTGLIFLIISIFLKKKETKKPLP